MPTIGEVLYVKSTEEPVTFIASRELNEDDHKKYPRNQGGGQVFIVRRPVVSDIHGINYRFFDFLAEELESAEEQTKRIYQKIKGRQMIAMGDIEPDNGPLSFIKKPS